MSLQSKFAVLIGLLSLTAAVSLGGALWSIGLLQREVSTPFTATTELTRDAREARARSSELQALISGHDSNGAGDTDAIRVAIGRFTDASSQLDDLDYGAVRLGARSAELLAISTAETTDGVLRWLDQPSTQDISLVSAKLLSHVGLLNRLESQAVESAELAVSHVGDVRRGILFVQALAVVTSVLAAVLALILHRRWIVEPVGRLRVGAERLATGDLDYRVSESGRDELAMLGREVNVMAATVKRMQKEAVEQERFAAVGQVVRRVAHNIRNPLAGIRGLAETALDDLPGDAEMRDSQERIISTVDRFDGWLTDFLHATSPHDVSPREVRASVWIEHALSALRPMAESRGVELRLDAENAPEMATFDPAQLEQALVAVVTNAVEVSPTRGVVAVSAASAGDEWEISVSDDGPGLDEASIGKLFEADFTTKPGGHGIGLTAARWIVRRHGGMMRAQNADEGSSRRGATFQIRLPVGSRRAHDDGEVDRAKHPDH